ncbi:MAG: MFS transporter [Actinomycetia bacterium]|nr:MFS transporter [Actinomycetes bacterium]
MAATTAAGRHGSTGGLTHRQILTVLVGLLLGMFLAALDQTIVATAIRTIGDDLKGLSMQAWVTTGFLITSTVATPLYGKLSDIYGRKPFFMLAIAVFILGSALCGLSTSMYMLAGFRAFQGIGAGGLFSLAMAIVGDIVAPRERARYQGYFMATFATSSVLGPVVGGFFAAHGTIFGITGWRWIFYINVPIGLVALVVVERVLRIAHHRRDHRIDWWGAFTLMVCLVPLLIVAEQGRSWGWGSLTSLGCFLLGVVGLAAFLGVESRMREEALIPLRLFRIGVFSVGSVQSFIIGMGMFGGMMSIPLYLQIVKDMSPTKSGLLMLPMVVGSMFTSLLSGQVTARTGRYKALPIIGTALLIGGFLLMTRVQADTTLWETGPYMLIIGAGLGLNMQTLVLAMQNAVHYRDMGVATSSATFFRQVGGTAGVAIFLSILFSTAGRKISAAYAAASQDPSFQAAAGAHQDQLKMLTSGSGGLNDTGFLHNLDQVLAHPFRVGFSQAMDLVFLCGAFVLVLAFVCAIFLKEVPLRKASALELRNAELSARAAKSGQGASSAETSATATAIAETPGAETSGAETSGAGSAGVAEDGADEPSGAEPGGGESGTP